MKSLAAAFSKKVVIEDDAKSFAFAFDVEDDDGDEVANIVSTVESKKKKKKKKKKTKKKSNTESNDEVPLDISYFRSSPPPSPTNKSFDITNSPKKMVLSPGGPHVISSHDPELDEEQRQLRRYGKGINVSIIGPKKKITDDWKRIPPGFENFYEADSSSVIDSSNGIQLSSSPFTFGFM